MDEMSHVAATLAASAEPLAVSEIVERSGLEYRDVDRILWGSPDRFVWQPGHKWHIVNTKERPRTTAVNVGPDARPGALTGGPPGELRAITLASGVVIRVSRLPLDSDAFFTVRSAGSAVQLVINSSHELFGELPMPFEDDAEDVSYKRLVEILLQAWALYEDSLMGGSYRRAMEDARLLWGRRTVEVLRDER